MEQKNFFPSLKEAEQQLYGVLGPEARQFSSDVRGHIDYVDGVYDPENRHISDAEMADRVDDLQRAVNESIDILEDLGNTAPEKAAYYISGHGIETGEQIEERVKGLLRDYHDVYSEIKASAEVLDESGRVSASPLLEEIEEIF